MNRFKMTFSKEYIYLYVYNQFFIKKSIEKT